MTDLKAILQELETVDYADFPLLDKARVSLRYAIHAHLKSDFDIAAGKLYYAFYQATKCYVVYNYKGFENDEELSHKDAREIYIKEDFNEEKAKFCGRIFLMRVYADYYDFSIKDHQNKKKWFETVWKHLQEVRGRI